MSLFGSAAGALTGNIGLYVVGGLVLAGAAAFGTQTWRLHSAQTDLATDRATFAKREAELSNRALAAEQRERLKEQAWAQQSEAITNETNRKLAAAGAAASAADGAARSLRDRVAAIAAAGRRACVGSSPAGGSEAATDALGMLADVLGRAETRTRLLALEADRRRERALGCEAEYEKLRNKAPAPVGVRELQ